MLFPEKEARELYTNFIGGSPSIAAEPGLVTNTGTGAANTQIASVYPNNVGIQQLATGTTATGSSVWNLDNGTFLLGAAPHRFRIVFQIPVLSVTGTTDFNLIFGFYNSSTTTDGCWFGINTSNQVTLNYLDNNVGSTGINVSGALPALVAGTWYAAVIDMNVPIVNSNQLASPNLGGPVTGARFYFGPQVPVATTGSFPSTNRPIGDIPISKLPGYSDTRTVGVQVSITGVNGATSKLLNVDSVYVWEGLMGYV